MTEQRPLTEAELVDRVRSVDVRAPQELHDRIEQMVAAVHKFPPLPQWYQGNAVQLELTLKFPEALERTQ